MAGPIDPAIRARLAEKGIKRDRLEEYASAFQMFDSDGSTFITVENLKHLLEEQFGKCLDALHGNLFKLSESARAKFPI